MDAPLLALTRKRAGAPSGPSPESVAADNMRQLIQLRWIAVAGQVVTILAVHFGLGVTLPLGPMLGVAAALAAANLAATLALPHHRVHNAEIMRSSRESPASRRSAAFAVRPSIVAISSTGWRPISSISTAGA